jgi:hypothetical protein
MTKKRATTAAKKGAPDPGPRSTVLTIKGTDDWKEWLNGLSDHLRMPTSTIVDLALVMYAKEKGYAREAPKR